MWFGAAAVLVLAAGGLVLLYVAFKITKALLKFIFILVALAALTGAGWWIYTNYLH